MQKKMKSLVLAAAVTVVSASSAFAALDADVESMFTAVDMSALKTKTAALLLTVLLIPLMFTGSSLVKRVIRSAKG